MRWWQPSGGRWPCCCQQPRFADISPQKGESGATRSDSNALRGDFTVRSAELGPVDRDLAGGGAGPDADERLARCRARDWPPGRSAPPRSPSAGPARPAARRRRRRSASPRLSEDRQSLTWTGPRCRPIPSWRRSRPAGGNGSRCRRSRTSRSPGSAPRATWTSPDPVLSRPRDRRADPTEMVPEPVLQSSSCGLLDADVAGSRADLGPVDLGGAG